MIFLLSFKIFLNSNEKEEKLLKLKLWSWKENPFIWLYSRPCQCSIFLNFSLNPFFFIILFLSFSRFILKTLHESKKYVNLADCFTLCSFILFIHEGAKRLNLFILVVLCYFGGNLRPSQNWKAQRGWRKERKISFYFWDIIRKRQYEMMKFKLRFIF